MHARCMKIFRSTAKAVILEKIRDVISADKKKPIIYAELVAVLCTCYICGDRPMLRRQEIEQS